MDAPTLHVLWPCGGESAKDRDYHAVNFEILSAHIYRREGCVLWHQSYVVSFETKPFYRGLATDGCDHDLAVECDRLFPYDDRIAIDDGGVGHAVAHDPKGEMSTAT